MKREELKLQQACTGEKNITKLLQNRLRLESISVLRDEEWSFRPGLELIAQRLPTITGSGAENGFPDLPPLI